MYTIHFVFRKGRKIKQKIRQTFFNVNLKNVLPEFE